jgi:hypothetical protein
LKWKKSAKKIALGEPRDENAPQFRRRWKLGTCVVMGRPVRSLRAARKKSIVPPRPEGRRFGRSPPKEISNP